MGKIYEIERWRSEIEMAEKFRNEQFGEYSDKVVTKAGENIDYFEKGFSAGFSHHEDDTTTTLNFFHVVAKLVVPTLFFQNPRVITLPKRKVDEESAPFAREILNYYYKELEVDFENELAVWDGYVLNRGVYKVGYATKFGMDIPDPDAKKKKKSTIDKALEAVGLKKAEKEEVVKPEIDQRIVAEKPYIKWVSPFRFLMDPRARTIDDAMWVCEEFDKTVAELKRNKSYKNTGKLKGVSPENDNTNRVKVPESQIDEFSVVRLYEIHYRNDDTMYRLVIVKDGEEFKELYHEESMYEMDGFQYDVLEFTRHGHLQFKRGDLMKIKNLQDRFTNVVDSILEQLDRFVPKVAYETGGVTPQGIQALRDGDIGALVECNKNPKEAIAEIGLTQFKADLKAILDEMINIITIMTGITKAKLLGVAPASETATGSQIAAGGENIRISDMSKSIQRFANRQAQKLWQIITQFVDLEELNLITGESGINPQTGAPIYNWLPDIDSFMSEKLALGEYRFDIEVGSTQKTDNALINKRVENLISILGSKDVIALIQQQGKKVDLAEVLRIWLQNNPEIVKDQSRIIQDINQNSQGLLPAQDILLGGRGGTTEGSNLNQRRALQNEPNDIIQQAQQL